MSLVGERGGRRSTHGWGESVLALLVIVGVGLACSQAEAEAARPLPPAPPEGALASITLAEVEADVRYLASPALEGRDTPSRGLTLAQRHLVECFASAGLRPPGDSADAWRRVHGDEPAPSWAQHPEGGIWLRPYSRAKLLFGRITLQTPVGDQCTLEVTVGESSREALSYGSDFVPLAECTGEVSGPLVFGGFGIESAQNRYDDLKGVDVKGHIVVILSGEPRHRQRFGGPDTTAEASVLEQDRLPGAAGGRGCPGRAPALTR